MPVLILLILQLYLLRQVTSVFACQGIHSQLNLNIYFFFLEVALSFFLCIRDTYSQMQLDLSVALPIKE